MIILAGIVVALALIPEAIAFSIIATRDASVGWKRWHYAIKGVFT